jgi:hypothetical protein
MVVDFGVLKSWENGPKPGFSSADFADKRRLGRREKGRGMNGRGMGANNLLANDKSRALGLPIHKEARTNQPVLDQTGVWPVAC